MNTSASRLCLAAVVLAACSDDRASTPPVDPVLEAKIERGRYLTNHVSLCGFCHTPLLADGSRDATRFLAGAPIDIRPADPASGSFPAVNLTPDPTGLASYGDDEIVAAIRDGTKLDGTGEVRLHPAYLYKNMLEEDALAIVAYLRTIPAVDSSQLPPRQPPLAMDALREPIDFAIFPMPQNLSGAELESAMRGRYLVGAAALCLDCHTPTLNGQTDTSKLLAGGRRYSRRQLYGQIPDFPDFIVTANATPAPTGIMGWTTDDFFTMFRKGHGRDGRCYCAPTHGGPTAPYAGLSDGDIEDIAQFLLAMPPVDNMVQPDKVCSASGFCVPGI